MFTRQIVNGPYYYEAKLGVVDLLAAFLRLHLIYNPETNITNKSYWNFNYEISRISKIGQKLQKVF